MSAVLCLAVVFAACASARAQDSVSIADAARANRARHAAQADQTTTVVPQPAVSANTIVAWHIAGMTASEMLDELKERGICFAVDEAHLNALKSAGLAPEVLAALPNVRSQPNASNPSEISVVLAAVSQAFSAGDRATARHALEAFVPKHQSAEVYAALANVDEVSGDLGAAQTAFLRAERLDPLFVYVHLRLAKIYYHFEDGPQMATEAKDAIRLQPNNAEARKYLTLSIGLGGHGFEDAAGSSGREGNNRNKGSDSNSGQGNDSKPGIQVITPVGDPMTGVHL